MEVRFVNQPYADGDLLLELIEQLVAEPYGRLTVVVAWVKRSGLRQVEPHLAEFRKRGGTAHLIAGIDEHGGTRQGFEDALSMFDTVHILFDRAMGTFHPKLYLAEGGSSALLLVGSHNLTAGGLFQNYEAGLLCTLDLRLEGDEQLHDQVVQYIVRLYGDEAACIPASPELIERLSQGPSPILRQEGRRKDDDADDRDARARQRPPDDFGPSQEPKKRPRRVRRIVEPTSPPQPQPQPAPPPPPEFPVVRRWSKEMSASDARHPRGAESHVTAVLRLAKGDRRRPIDQRTYFREVFFGDAPWQRVERRGKPYDEVRIDFDVFIDGVFEGPKAFLIDHAPHRVSNQGNDPTVLHWGDFKAALDATNYTGRTVVLERLSNDRYRLHILGEAQPVPGFLP